MKTVCIVVAAGQGTRLSKKIPKQFIRIGQIPLLILTLKRIEQCSTIDYVILVTNPKKINYTKKLINEFGITKIKCIIPGGKSRAESVWNGLKNVTPATEIVLIHDGARPNIDNDLLKRVIKGARKFSACIPAVEVKDTIKLIKDGIVDETLPKHQLYSIQTPQGFKYDLIFHAYKNNQKNLHKFTDDSAIVETFGIKVRVVEGSEKNYKITTEADLLRLKNELIKNRDYRIGIGYDIHRLTSKRKLFLGGIEIPYNKGLLGHSDGDVLLHAIVDALLGSIGHKDIGYLFPPEDSKWKDMKSSFFLNHTIEMVKRKGYVISHIDTVIIAEQPKLTPYRDRLINSIANLLAIEKDKLSLKFKTAESLGPIGHKKAIASLCITLLERSSICLN